LTGNKVLPGSLKANRRLKLHIHQVKETNQSLKNHNYPKIREEMTGTRRTKAEVIQVVTEPKQDKITKVTVDNIHKQQKNCNNKYS
jgi:hypothetical protein